jgi:hypothetical protein
MKASKRFFFEKKNQKTFGPFYQGRCAAGGPRGKSFFASFFSKKEAFPFNV